MNIKLYDYAPSRSTRCRWILNEVEAEYEVIKAREMIGTDELKKIHPLGKVPAVVIDDKPLFESAAICTYIAEQFPEKGLIAAPGTWARALHDQWTCFALTEMEAWLWSSALNDFLLPEAERIPAISEQNTKLFTQAAEALDKALADDDYLVENKFTVTDIIVGFTINWANNIELIGPFKNLHDYLDRLYQRPSCTLKKM